MVSRDAIDITKESGMQQSRYYLYLLILMFVCFLAACDRNKTVCPPDKETTQPTLQLADLIKISPPIFESSDPIQVEIGGMMMNVDKLVDYPLCNDVWSGTVYVSCDAQVAEWDSEEGSRFLKGCNLTIDPDAVVYVAAHNDAPHYKGCSCHTGEVYEINTQGVLK
jgi:hypothetical protein